MAKIVFTKHARFDKFSVLSKHGFIVKSSQIKDVVENPEHEDKDSDYPNTISS